MYDALDITGILYKKTPLSVLFRPDSIRTCVRGCVARHLLHIRLIIPRSYSRGLDPVVVSDLCRFQSLECISYRLGIIGIHQIIHISSLLQFDSW